MIWEISLGVIAFVLGYLYGRRITRQELRILDLYMEQLERIKADREQDE